jgi:hypothetical protein
MITSFQELMAVPVSTEATNETGGTEGEGGTGVSTEPADETSGTNDEEESSAASPAQVGVAAVVVSASFVLGFY